MSPLKRALAAVPDLPSGLVECSAITVPEIDPDADALTAAFALAAAGLYVLPTAGSGDSKHAGSVLGAGWPSKSSRDPEQLAAWFAGTDHRVAVHCGRSGLIVADVDHPENLPDELGAAIDRCAPPFHSTRPDEPGRGHYLFAQPAGRRIGNRAGQTGKAWGEWRGDNGIVLVGGPGRTWLRVGPVPILPDTVADLLPDVGDTESAVSDAEIGRFVSERTLALAPTHLEPVLSAFRAEVAAGGSRHNAATSAACWIARESIEGRYPAKSALRRLAGEFVDAMTETGRDGQPVSRTSAENEFASVVGWAVAQEWRPSGAPTAVATEEPVEDPTAHLKARARDLQVAERAERLRVDEEARRKVDAERVGVLPPIEDHLVWDDEFDDVPPPRMLIPRLLPECAVGWLGGPSGSYKSFVAVSIAAGLAYGTRVLDDEALTPRATQRVLYVAGEGSAGVVLRSRAVRRRLGITATRALAIYRRPFDLGSTADAERLVAFAVANGIEFVIVDTWRQSTPGVEENDNTAVSLVLHRLLAARDEHGLNFLLLDHTNKSAAGLADLGGAGAKRANADYVLMVDLPGMSRDESEPRTLRAAKFKDAPDGHTWPLRLVRVPDVTDADGVPAAVAVIGQVGGSVLDGRGEWWADPDPELIPDAVAALTGRACDAARDVYRVLAFIGDGDEGSTRSALIRAVNAAPGRDYSDATVDRALRMLRDDANVIVSSGRGRYALTPQHLEAVA